MSQSTVKNLVRKIEEQEGGNKSVVKSLIRKLEEDCSKDQSSCPGKPCKGKGPEKTVMFEEPLVTNAEEDEESKPRIVENLDILKGKEEIVRSDEPNEIVLEEINPDGTDNESPQNTEEAAEWIEEREEEILGHSEEEEVTNEGEGELDEFQD